MLTIIIQSKVLYTGFIVDTNQEPRASEHQWHIVQTYIQKNHNVRNDEQNRSKEFAPNVEKLQV